MQKLTLLLASLIFMSITDATLIEDVQPGDITVKLNDSSYKMSFSLPDRVMSYDIETASASNDFLNYQGYDVYIKESGIEDSLLTIMVYVWQEPQIFPIYEEMNRDEIEGYGTSITMPMEIDGLDGHATYNYPLEDPAVDPFKALGGAFKYYPNAWRKGDDLEGIYEVTADTFAAAMNDSRVMPIFQEVMQTIHLSGV